MPMYMLQFAYTSDAWASLAKNPADRSQPVQALAEKLGGKLVGLYYCFGEYDGVVLVEAPDDATATAMVIAAGAPGHLKATRTTRLMTVEEAMEAMRKAGSVTYQAPSAG
jgi:uncharacterized protein with GYD domain